MNDHYSFQVLTRMDADSTIFILHKNIWCRKTVPKGWCYVQLNPSLFNDETCILFTGFYFSLKPRCHTCFQIERYWYLNQTLVKISANIFVSLFTIGMKNVRKSKEAVNFINILCANFLYEHCFGSFSYVVTREKLPKQHSYKKFAHKMLIKFTTG